MTRVVGIDYSMTCPCMTVIDTDKGVSFADSKVYFVTDIKKYQGRFQNTIGITYPTWRTPMARYVALAWLLIKEIGNLVGVNVFIEDYSMGSKGKTFNIAENTAVLKYKFFEAGINPITVPPTVIKKFFHGKGNAGKNEMYEAFQQRTKVNLYKQLAGGEQGVDVKSPFSDIVDSYALALYGVQHSV